MPKTRMGRGFPWHSAENPRPYWVFSRHVIGFVIANILVRYAALRPTQCSGMSLAMDRNAAMGDPSRIRPPMGREYSGTLAAMHQ